MPTVSRKIFANTLEDAGVPEPFIKTLTLLYKQGNMIDKNIMDYVIKMDWAGVGGEQIMTIIWNTVNVNGILNVPKFFREIGPLAKKWGFYANRIKRDKKIFDLEIAQYTTQTMTVGAAKKRLNTSDMYPIPTDIRDEILHAARVRPNVKSSQLYTAAIDMAATANLLGWGYDIIINVIHKCNTPTGFDVRRMMRLTTPRHRGGEHKEMVSRSDGVTTKPVIRMRDINLIHATHNFFTKNADKIRDIAFKYNGDDFFYAYYDLFTNWNEWPFKIQHFDVTQIPIHTPQRELVSHATHMILRNLPKQTRHSIATVSEQDFQKIVPNAKSTFPYEIFVR